MVISCEQYEAPCTFSSEEELLFYMQLVGGSNPSGCTKVDRGMMMPITRECMSVGVIGVGRHTPK